MKKIASAIGFAVLLIALGSTPANAQQLVPGMWTGTMTPPGGGSLAVTFEVAQMDDSYSVVMKTEEFEEEMPFQDVKVEEGQMTFWWDPGVRVDCTLFANDDGGFEGKCTDGTGPRGEGALRMVPPSN